MSQLLGLVWAEGEERVLLEMTPDSLAAAEEMRLPDRFTFSLLEIRDLVARLPKSGSTATTIGRLRVLKHLVAHSLRGGSLLGVCVGEQVAYRMLFRLGPQGIRWGFTGEVYLQIPRGVAYVEYGETDPQWRGQGIYPAALQWTARHVFGLGIERVWGDTPVSNLTSIRGLQRAGFFEIRRLRPKKKLNALWRRVFPEGAAH